MQLDLHTLNKDSTNQDAIGDKTSAILWLAWKHDTNVKNEFPEQLRNGYVWSFDDKSTKNLSEKCFWSISDDKNGIIGKPSDLLSSVIFNRSQNSIHYHES